MEPVELLGYVIDSENGDPLAANVYGIRGGEVVTTRANNAGEYGISVDPGTPVRVSFVGYTAQTFTAPDVPPADPPTHYLAPGYALEEFEVVGERKSGIGALLAMLAVGVGAALKSRSV